MSRAKSLFLFLLFSFFFYSNHSFAQTYSGAYVPDELRPWVNWVLAGHPDRNCPTWGESSFCVWSLALNISTSETSGHFEQNVVVLGETDMTLPGDSENWPLQVTIGDKPLATFEKNGKPTVHLQPGVFQISGSWFWKSRPEALTLPEEIAFVRHDFNGMPVASIERDAEGRLVLDAVKKTATHEESSVTLEVQRRIEDGQPLTDETLFLLNISGAPQTITISEPVLEGFIPYGLESELPARFDKEGRLLVSARPGRWTVTLHSQRTTPTNFLKLSDKATGRDFEIWTFHHDNTLRHVTLSGGNAIDPQQTTLPTAWRQDAAFRFIPGEALTLTELSRGDHEATDDHFRINRELWLGLDGETLHARDQISGNARKTLRFNAFKGVTLGRARINQEDNVLTGDSKKNEGINLPRGPLNIQAESRFNKNLLSQTVTGWKSRFDGASIVLNLPPGWKLFSAWGADKVYGDITSRWRTLESFLFFLLIIVAAKVLGLRSLLFLAPAWILTLTESETPTWYWLIVLMFVALATARPDNRFIRILTVFNISFLAIWLTFYTVQDLRTAIHPVLGKRISYSNFSREYDQVALQDQDDEGYGGTNIDEEPTQSPYPSSVFKTMSRAPLMQQKTKKIAAPQNAQTGFGMPSWQWSQARFEWHSPLNENQNMKIYLLSPNINRVISFGRALFLMMSLFFLFRPFRKNFSLQTKSSVVVITLLIMSGLGFVSRPVSAESENIPSAEILKDLENRLLKKPECEPDCRRLSSVALRATGNILRAEFVFDAAAPGIVSLPVEHDLRGLLAIGLADGKPLPLLRLGDTQIGTLVSDGRSTVVLEWSLENRPVFTLPLSNQPLNVTTLLEDWDISGLDSEGRGHGPITLTRHATQEISPSATPEVNTLSLNPRFRLERTLSYDSEWRLDSILRRLDADNKSRTFKIPLLAGEKILSADVTANKEMLEAILTPDQNEVMWSSLLPTPEPLTLKTSGINGVMETWIIHPSSEWILDIEGIPAIFEPTLTQNNPIIFMPWPGENISIQAEKPIPLDRPTLTIDKAFLKLSPSRRETNFEISLQLRSSLGDSLKATFPATPENLTLTIDNNQQPIHKEGKNITLTLAPGSHNIKLTGLLPSGMNAWFMTPKISFSHAGMNSEIEITKGESRWVVALAGPAFGPVVHFWSLCAGFILLAFALSRIPLSLPRFFSWFVLLLGLSQLSFIATVVVIFWLIAIGLIEKSKDPSSAFLYGLRQLFFWGWGLLALGVLFWGVQRGLIGEPDMMIGPNQFAPYGSIGRWQSDTFKGVWPDVTVISTPMYVFRLTMLAWSLWLATFVVKKIRQAWNVSTRAGFFKGKNSN